MSQVAVKVVVDDAHLEKVEEVVERLRDSGMTIEETMPDIGAIFGSVEADALPKIARTRGVHEARREYTVQLPPFSEKVPQ